MHNVRNQSGERGGKPLADAAKTTAIKKCCETAAVSKDGRPFVGRCEEQLRQKCVRLRGGKVAMLVCWPQSLSGKIMLACIIFAA